MEIILCYFLLLVWAAVQRNLNIHLINSTIFFFHLKMHSCLTDSQHATWNSSIWTPTEKIGGLPYEGGICIVFLFNNFSTFYFWGYICVGTFFKFSYAQQILKEVVMGVKMHQRTVEKVPVLNQKKISWRRNQQKRK